MGGRRRDERRLREKEDGQVAAGTGGIPKVLDMRRATGGLLAVLSLQFRAEICHLRLKAPL